MIDIRTVCFMLFLPSKKNATKNRKLHVVSRYLGGSLQLMNVPGTGVDAFLALEAEGSEKEPRGPNPNPEQHQPICFGQ